MVPPLLPEQIIKLLLDDDVVFLALHLTQLLLLDELLSEPLSAPRVKSGHCMMRLIGGVP